MRGKYLICVNKRWGQHMRKRKEQKVIISGNRIFVLVRTLLVVIFSVTLIFSILDKIFQIIPWPEGYENTIAVSSQIITAVITLVVSIIGIAISLQGDEFFGVKITKLYALRVNKHYPILWIIVISVLTCTANLTFYMLGLTVAAIGSLVVGILFLLQVIYMEIPIMTKQEKAFLKILRDNLIFCYLNNKEASKDLKTSIKYLLYTENLKGVFESFKDKSDEQYNEYVLIKLLEFQHDLAFEIRDKYSEKERCTIGSSLLENTVDVMLRYVDTSDNIYIVVSNNKYLLTRVLFRVHEVELLQKQLLGKITVLVQYLSFDSEERKLQQKLISDIIIILVAGTVEQGDFGVIKAIRHQLSNSSYCLNIESSVLDVFAVISMYLYYLSCSDSDVPPKIRNEVLNFINEGDTIEDRTKITSWKKLFSKAAYNFNVNYDKFMDLAMRNSKTLEYYLFGNGAKCVIIDQLYLSRWYFTQLLNAKRTDLMDFLSLISQDTSVRNYLRTFGDKCIDEDKNFVPTGEMKRIVEFYNDEKECFLLFKLMERQEHKFFDFINSLKYEELKSRSEQAADVDNVELATKIQKGIASAIESEWGFNPRLPLSDTKRYISVALEKMPDAVNFEQCIIDSCVNSILDELKKASHETVVYNNEEFESKIRDIILNNPRYITKNAKELIPKFYIRNEKLKQEYIDACDASTVFESRILGESVVVCNSEFQFNCKLEEVECRELSEEELDRQVAEYQRADGQFVYDGVFLPREEIIKTIRTRYIVLTVIINYCVDSSEEDIYKLITYLSGPEDE